MSPDSNVFIVTGSATGVGAACAKRLSASGHRVVINYSKSEAEALETQAACQALGGETLLVRADVSSDIDCRRLASEALGAWGRIDGLVNNAATTKPTDPLDLDALTMEDFQHIFAVNVVGSYQMVRAVMPTMRRSGAGAIINVSSNVAMTGGGTSAAYTASKGAINAMTLYLARVLGPEIRVNAVCPGVIDTRWMRNAVGEEGYAAIERRFSDQAPLRRVARPEDVADAIAWLLEGAQYVTGEIITLDGGVHLAPPPARRT